MIAKLDNFIKESKTFDSFVFDGCYEMPRWVFVKLFSEYVNSGCNYLDVYSKLQYLKWEIDSAGENYYDYDKINEAGEYISIARKLKLFDQETISEMMHFLKDKRTQHTKRLEAIRSIPRTNACRFTSKPKTKEFVFNKYGRRCLACGSEDKITIDHVIPIFKGGTDTLDNLQPLCKSCNSKKGIQTTDYR